MSLFGVLAEHRSPFMHEDEKFIRANIGRLLLNDRVKAETERIGGQWKLFEITARLGTGKNIQFNASLTNDANRFLDVFVTINRATGKLSKIEIKGGDPAQG